MDTLKLMRQFMASSESLVRISGNLTSMKGPLLVLDSSFNPPTLAHMSLIKAAVSRYPSSPQVLLLLGTSNPDKPTQTPENYAHRLAMIQLFAKELSFVASQPVIALTKHSRFIDKVSDMQQLAPWKTIVFLVGYDTLLRIFDPKYYLESEFDSAIQRLLTTAQFCCVAREFNTTTSMPQVGSVATQLEFSKSVPQMAQYADRIVMVQPQSKVSSSQARKVASASSHEQQSMPKLSDLVPKSIASYIHEHKLYV